jgi:hypothetical protein
MKIGDMVKVNERGASHWDILNVRMIGRVVYQCPDLLGGTYYSVEWQGMTEGHNCNGYAKDGAGWNVYDDDVDVIKEHN